MTSVRVIHSPKSVDGDPDENPENPRVLKDIDWIIYGGSKGTSKVFVWLSDGTKGYVSITDSSFATQSYNTLGADQHHLWISAAMGYGALVATHTSIVRSLKDPSQHLFGPVTGSPGANPRRPVPGVRRRDPVPDESA